MWGAGLLYGSPSDRKEEAVRSFFSLFGMIALTELLACSPTQAAGDPSNTPVVVIPQDLFARVNNVTLHYLDWGGKGDILLCIPGLTHTAHSFDGIAPAFTDRYHVLGLTRRGHGASEKPATGYDLNTLVTDIVEFLNLFDPKRAVLLGHSFAGLEMPEVAVRLKDRVTSVVFLDAVYDWGTVDHKNINRMFEPPDSALRSREALDNWSRKLMPQVAGPVQTALLLSQTYVGPNGRIFWQLPAHAGEQLSETTLKGTEYVGLRAPALAIWANMSGTFDVGMKSLGYSASDIEYMRKWTSTTDVANKQRGIAALKKAVPNASIVEMSGPHALHMHDPAKVIRLINDFLKANMHPSLNTARP